MIRAMQRAVAFGAGGVTGTAWSIGLLRGFEDRGLNLSRADILLGTSTGAVTAALIAGERSLEELLEEQLQIPDGVKPERVRALPPLRTAVLGLRTSGADRDKRRAIATAAASGAKDSAEPAVVAAEERFGAWPDVDLRIAAVQASTGELRVFTRHDGVSLGRAITASAAIPFLRPPVEIGGDLYVDGSLRSQTNADKATGASRIIVFAPRPNSRGRGHSVPEQIKALGDGIPAAAMAPDRRSLRAIKEKIYDVRRCPPAARAGYRQSGEMFSAVADAWHARKQR